jgi:hypothetical protein
MKKKVRIYCSSGYRVRAEKLQVLIEEMLVFYKAVLGLNPRVKLAVFTRNDWEDKNATSYGMPNIKGFPPVIFMPATPGGVVYNSTLGLENVISKELMTQVTEQGITFEEAVSMFVDLIILHELGHYFVKKYGILPQTKWLYEMLATYFGYLFLNAAIPKMKNLWDLIATRLFIENVSPKHRSLTDFEKLYSGVGPQNYCWYQAMFNLRVSEICSNQGILFLKEMKMEFPATPFRPKIKHMKHKDLLERLERIAPGFKKWVDAFDI